MNQLVFLVLYNHTKARVHVEYFDENEYCVIMHAQRELDFPGFSLGHDDEAFRRGNSTYRYMNKDGDEIEAQIVTVPGIEVKELFANVVVDHQNAWEAV